MLAVQTRGATRYAPAERLQHSLAGVSGMQIDVIEEQATFIKGSVKPLKVYLILGGVRTSLTVSCSIAPNAPRRHRVPMR